AESASHAGLLAAGGGLLGAPAARIPALAHAGGAVVEGRIGVQACQIELVAVGAGLDRSPAAAVEWGLRQRRIVEGAEHVAAEVPAARRPPRTLAVLEPAVAEIGLAPRESVAVVAVQ